MHQTSFAKVALAALLALAITLPNFVTLASSEFEGVWKVQDSSGKTFQITLSADGSAKSDWGKKGMVGTWRDEGGVAVIKWNSGWTNKISKEGDKYTSTAYSKGKPLNGPPTATSQAEKVAP